MGGGGTRDSMEQEMCAALFFGRNAAHVCVCVRVRVRVQRRLSIYDLCVAPGLTVNMCVGCWRWRWPLERVVFLVFLEIVQTERLYAHTHTHRRQCVLCATFVCILIAKIRDLRS